MKKILLVSDLHLDETEENRYRWDIFGQLEDKYHEENLDSLYILGDITDKKDRHSGKFVNELIDQLDHLRDKYFETILLAGNHDYVDQNLPYLAFDSQMFYGKAFEPRPDDGFHGIKVKELFLPHVRNPEEVYAKVNPKEFDIIFTHLDVKGTTFENGMKSMEGLPVSFFGNVLTFSGHIHNGQKVGKNFHYIGSPYSIIYEKPNVLHRGIILTYDDNGNISWKVTYFEFPRKIVKVVKSKKDIPDLDDGNMYKIRVVVNDSELDKYKEIKSVINDDNVKFDLSVKSETNKKKLQKCTDYFAEYCEIHNLDEQLINAGKEIMKDGKT